MRILIVDDHEVLAGSVAELLKINGFAADLAKTLEEASAAVGATQYDAILLDRALPDGDGISWIRERRRSGLSVGILITAAERTDVDARVEGLNAGADDYVVKPFSLDELVARLRAVLRRPAAVLEPVLRAGNIEFDPASRQVWIGTEKIHVPRRELRLLEALMRRVGKVVPRAALEESSYSYDSEVSSNAIEVGVYRLRVQLQGAGATAAIRTVRGVGYVLDKGTGDDVPEPSSEETFDGEKAATQRYGNNRKDRVRVDQVLFSERAFAVQNQAS